MMKFIKKDNKSPDIGSARRILITGMVASGKSTLARQLADKTGIPLYELDNIAHPIHKSHYGRPHDEQKTVLEEIDRNGSWIFEGTDRKYQRYLFDWADLILFIDPPLAIRKRRILTRFVKQLMGLEDCRYRPSVKMFRLMYKWTAEFEGERAGFETFLGNFGDKVIYLS